MFILSHRFLLFLSQVNGAVGGLVNGVKDKFSVITWVTFRDADLDGLSLIVSLMTEALVSCHSGCIMWWHISGFWGILYWEFDILLKLLR